MPEELKARVITQVFNIRFEAGEVVIHADHFITFLKEPFAKV